MMSSGNSSENQIRHLGGVGPSAKEKKQEKGDRYLMLEISAEFAKNVFAQTQNETFIQNHVNY